MSTVLPLPRRAPAPTSALQHAFALQRDAFERERCASAAQRIDRLDRLLLMTQRIAPRLAREISADFGHRPRQVTQLADILTVEAAIRHARRHLRGWMKPRHAPTSLIYRPGFNRLLPQPLGVVGIVSPWNYPYQLAMSPAVGALAAGNRVMIKPSELTPRCAALMAQAVAEHFTPEEMTVVEGDVSVGQAFVALPFDHLLFTGSSAVGRQVALTAAAKLTPVTLELGGKSPAILNDDVDLRVAVPRLVMGKLFNAGQTCIAPDWAAVPRALLPAFVHAMQREVKRQFARIADNPDYTSIVSERHLSRLTGLLDDARAKGARVVALHDETEVQRTRKLPPFLVLDVSDEMAIMREEIFGPLLPVVAYERLDEVIARVNAGERPLALYWFGRSRADRERVLQQTVSGGVTINDSLLHVAQEDLPFGGVGDSGSGAYHGEHGFETFSQLKPVHHQGRFSTLRLVYPPYGKRFDAVLRLLRRLV